MAVAAVATKGVGSRRLVHVDAYTRHRRGRPQFVDAHFRGTGGRARVGDEVVAVTVDGAKVAGRLEVGADKVARVAGKELLDIAQVTPVPRERRRTSPPPGGPVDRRKLYDDIYRAVVLRSKSDLGLPAAKERKIRELEQNALALGRKRELAQREEARSNAAKADRDQRVADLRAQELEAWRAHRATIVGAVAEPHEIKELHRLQRQAAITDRWGDADDRAAAQAKLRAFQDPIFERMPKLGAAKERAYARRLASYWSGLNPDGSEYAVLSAPSPGAFNMNAADKRKRAEVMNRKAQAIARRHGVRQPLAQQGARLVTPQGRSSMAIHRGRVPWRHLPGGPDGPEHDASPLLPDEQRRYKGHGATLMKPAPRSVRDLRTWDQIAHDFNVTHGTSYSRWTSGDRDYVLKQYRKAKGLGPPSPAERMRDISDGELVELAQGPTRLVLDEIADRDAELLAVEHPRRAGLVALENAVVEARKANHQPAVEVLEQAVAIRSVLRGGPTERRRVLDRLSSPNPLILRQHYLNVFDELDDRELRRSVPSGTQRRQYAEALRAQGHIELADRLERLHGRRPRETPGLDGRRPTALPYAQRYRPQQQAAIEVQKLLRDEDTDSRVFSLIANRPQKILQKQFNQRQLQILGAMAAEAGNTQAAKRLRSVAGGQREHPTAMRTPSGRLRDLGSMSDLQLASLARNPGARFYYVDPEGFDHLATELARRNWAIVGSVERPGRDYRLTRLGSQKVMLGIPELAPKAKVAQHKPLMIAEDPLPAGMADNFARVDLEDVRTAFFGGRRRSGASWNS
jgi:hypothetical protein